MKKITAEPKRRRGGLRTTIIAFRLRTSEAKLLNHDLRQNPPSGIKSLKMFARKICVDYALKHLVYIEPEVRIGPVGMELPPPDCQMTDPAFLNALSLFLRNEENWKKLRLFMLRSGWPEDLLQEHYRAENDHQRLAVAQRVIARMLNHTP